MMGDICDAQMDEIMCLDYVQKKVGQTQLN